MSFQLDLNQELKSLFDISDVLFLDVLDTNSERFSETISKADLEKQRIQRISKKNNKKNNNNKKQDKMYGWPRHTTEKGVLLFFLKDTELSP